MSSYGLAVRFEALRTLYTTINRANIGGTCIRTYSCQYWNLRIPTGTFQIKIPSVLRDLGHRSLSSNSRLDEFTNLPLQDSKKGNLIYSGPLSKMIRGVKIFSLSTSLLSLSLQPIILHNSTDTPLAMKIAFGSFFTFFIVITPMLIHMISRKYVTDLYFDNQTKVFTAAKYNFFCKRIEIPFKAEDVKVPDLTGPFTSVIIKGAPLFMDPKFFHDKQGYIHLMGYDKPIEWELPRPEDKNNQTKK